jgi:hypothetical protein
MMKLVRLEIEEFRGIRHLVLDLGARSFLVHGPNGSGKSGVVDAIDFAITGDVSRLSGPGTGDLSLIDHAPHVHKRNDPASARVTLTFVDPATGDEAVLRRTVKTPQTFSLTPDTSALRQVVKDAAGHPEQILTRREVIKFVLTEPGKRANEVQALLQLHSLGEFRRNFRTLQGTLRTRSRTADAEVTSATAELAQHLDRNEVLLTELLAAVNRRRLLLDADALTGIDADTKLDAGVKSGDAGTHTEKATWLQLVGAAVSAAERWRSEERSALLGGLTEAVGTLQAVVNADAVLARAALARQGLAAIQDNHCPLCDTAWDSEQALREHLDGKVEESTQLQALQSRTEDTKHGLAAGFLSLRNYLVEAGTIAVKLSANEQAAVLRSAVVAMDSAGKQLATARGHGEVASVLALEAFEISAAVESALSILLDAIRTLPDPSEAAAAASWLAVADDRWRRLVRSRVTADRAAAAAAAADAIYVAYCRAQDDQLEALYGKVEHRFSAFYRHINDGDEDGFRAALEPSAGKLDLSVDFYGIGMFPPGAYHSEGHQDGMGLSLYLALLEELMGGDLALVVLDDVITSVDIHHRRRLCGLLETEFPDVQFVITTHEPVWARTLTSRLIKRKDSIEFLSWNVDSGPICAQHADTFQRVAEDLEAGDTSAAAAKLRRYLEYRLREAAEDLQSKVIFREDGAYNLSDFMSAVISRHRELLKKALASARSFKRTDVEARVAELEVARLAAVADHETEQWALNKLVHYDPKVHLSAEEFAVTVEAAQGLLALLECATCATAIRAEGPGSATTLRCQCGDYMLNLVT